MARVGSRGECIWACGEHEARFGGLVVHERPHRHEHAVAPGRVPAFVEAIEQRLMGLEEGAHAVIELAAGEAFGERQPEMVQWVARKLLNDLGDPNEQYKPGDVVQFPTPDGLGTYAGSVLQVREDGALLFDFNHPLAGQPLVFEVQLIGVL